MNTSISNNNQFPVFVLEIVFVGVSILLVTSYTPVLHLALSFRVFICIVAFLLASFMISLGVRRIVNITHFHHYLKHTFRLRLLITGVASGLLGVAVAFFCLLVLVKTSSIFIDDSATKPVYFISFFSSMFIAFMYEAMLLNKEQESNVLVFEQLQKERLSAEMDALKSELEPHFIVNSFYALSHLINTDAEKAKHYVQKISEVYKYVLTHKSGQLISLEDELKFIDNYYYLLSIRYGNKVVLKKNIAIDDLDKMIMPLSLQALFENAIKHNSFSEQQPLEVSIYTKANYVIVSNEIREKLLTIESTKIGLKNLKARYRLFVNKPIVVMKTKANFIVKVPLVKYD